MHVVREAAAPRDLDDGNPLAVLGLELRIAVDRDLAQLEAELVAGRIDDATGRLTQMAARRAVERDFGKVYG
jgi:hypothetical protein